MAIGLRSYRPLVGGVTHMVSTGHYLATAAGYRILEQGGNAIDAGVAAGIVINVTLPQYTSFGGVAPIIVHHAASGETREISGLGRWPAEASIDYFRREHGGDMPHGVMRTVTPAAADAWITALRRYGTMTFEQVVTPALELAAGGFPIPATLHRALVSSGDNIILDEGDTSQWSSTMEIFYPGGQALEIGDLLVQSDLARTFQRMIDAERAAAGQGREGGLQAARDLFYTGEIAEEMVAFIRSQGGWLSMNDLAGFAVGVDVPPMIDYKGPDSAKIDVYACGPWCQGPMNLHALRILEGCDLRGMGHNSADYIHTVLEALKLAFADRHAYYGDPDFVDVPMDGLLSREYADVRRRQIDALRANPEMPDAGDPWAHQSGKGRGGAQTGAGGRPPVCRHILHLRCRPLGQCLLGDAQRRIRRSAHRLRLGVHGFGSRRAELAGRRSPRQPGARQAPAPDAQPRHGVQRRQTLDALRHAGRRRAAPVHGATVPQRGRVWHGRAAGHRGAAGVDLELPQLLLAPRLSSRAGGHRVAHRPVGGRRTSPARPRRGRVERVDAADGFPVRD